MMMQSLSCVCCCPTQNTRDCFRGFVVQKYDDDEYVDVGHVDDDAPHHRHHHHPHFNQDDVDDVDVVDDVDDGDELIYWPQSGSGNRVSNIYRPTIYICIYICCLEIESVSLFQPGLL